jgi:hypothetical protein
MPRATTKEVTVGIVLTAQCPAGLATLLEYGVSDGGLSFLITNDGHRVVWTLERIP